jgi:2-haloacid dehalogenase
VIARVRAVAFDCFGTLIDWEAGLLTALGTLLSRHGMADPPEPAALLTLYAELESQAESGVYRPYREVLASVAEGLARRLGLRLPATDRTLLADSLASWPAFRDTAPALRRLKACYRLAVISNVDDDLFEPVLPKLGLAGAGGLDALVTAQQVGSYKPDPGHLREVLTRLGLEPAELLVAACSLYHDIAPAGAMGVPTCWVDRRQLGASGQARAAPTMTVTSLTELADRLGA